MTSQVFGILAQHKSNQIRKNVNPRIARGEEGQSFGGRRGQKGPGRTLKNVKFCKGTILIQIVGGGTEKPWQSWEKRNICNGAILTHVVVSRVQRGAQDLI